MKRTWKRLFSSILVVILCITMLPINVYAWSYMSHANSANILYLKTLSNNFKYSEKSTDVYTLLNNEIDKSLRYSIPKEFYDAITKYPEAFRAGSLGPDFYPDMLIGQMYIHPYDDKAKVGSGDWLYLLIDSVNRLPQYSEGRLEALSFTLGYMLHYCGDLFGHDFVNTFSGGTFASFTEVDIPLDPKEMDTLDDPELNNILSHMAIESTMDSFINVYAYGSKGLLPIKAPNKFVTDTLVLKGNMPSGVADIYYKFEDIDVGSGEEEESDLLSGIPIYLDVIVTFREGVMAVADKFRPNTELITMGISSYADQWAQDIDRALYGLTDTFDMIAHRLVTGEKNPNIEEETLHDWVLEGYPLKEILKDMLDLDEVLGNAEGGKQNAVSVIVEELSLWVDTYAWKALGIPDVFVDGLPEWLDYITLVFTWPMDIVLAAVKTAFAAIFAAILVEALDSEITWALSVVEGTKARLEEAAVQLDHEDNPYKPFAYNYNELKRYFNDYHEEQQLLSNETVESLISDSSGKHVLDQLVDSNFEAFYNTMAMFKLILMGPENFTAFFKSQTGGATQTAYTTNIAQLEATVLRLAVKTIDMPRSGTDDNVWAYVYGVDKNGKLSNEPIAKKLLDNSLNNDLECGDTNIFDIDLPKPLKLTEFEIILEQDETATVNGGWGCESINVIPMHAGVPLCYPIGVGGNLHMNDGVIWNLEFQKALHYHRQSSTNGQWPVTHVEVKIQTGNGDYDSGTDQDVKLYASSTEIGSIAVDLDKYLYNDFEDGDDDTYMVPIGYMFRGDRTNTYPTLGNLHLSLKQNSDYDWYVKSVTVTPYYGTIKLSEPWTIKDQWIKKSEDKIDLTPDKNNMIYYGRNPLTLTYETALDDGLLEGIRSLDAGVQWTEMPVFWDTPEGRNFFFKYFKGFKPYIELTLEDDIVGATAPVTMTIDLHGNWNGVGETRRNALAEYAQKTLGQDTYSKMSPVTGDVTIEIIHAETGVVAKSAKVQNATGKAEVTLYQYGMYSYWTPGTYNIRVVYDPSSSASQEYSYSEKTFKNVFTVPASTVGKTLRVRENNMYYGDTTGAGIYQVGSTVTVTAQAAEGYKFVKWALGDGSRPPLTTPTSARQQITVTDDMTLVAVFEPITCTITAKTNDRDNRYGTVSGGGTYNYGDGGTLTPIPADGYVFAGWYGNAQGTGEPISTENPLLFTATTDATIYAKFVPAVTVKVSKPDGDECGYRVFVDNDNSDALQGSDQKEDMVGKSFEVAKGNTVTFALEIQDGYIAGNDFKVQVETTSTGLRPLPITLTLTPTNGTYTFQANKKSTINISGVERDQTATPTITCTEDANGRLTIAATGEGVITLYVNGKAVSNPYTFAPNDTALSVHAIAQAEGKAPSDLGTLNNSRFVVPIVIEDSANGTVEVDEKYDVPGRKATLSILPKEGYVLDKLTITSEDGSEIEYTSQDIVEIENEDGGIDIEIVEQEGTYYFARPSGKATVRALFRKAGGVTIRGTVKTTGTASQVLVELRSADGSTLLDTFTGETNEFSYEFQGVPSGTYIIRVSKAKHVTRDYTVTIP